MLGNYGSSIEIKKAVKRPGKDVVIKGWLHRKRSSGGKIFAIIRDPTGTLQCVVDKSAVKGQEWNSIDRAYLESSIIVRGSIRKDPRAPTGFEMNVKELSIVHSGEQFPITEYQSAEFLLDVRHLWLRSERMRLIMQARAHILGYLREFLDRRKFYEITPPLLTQSGGETGADLFEVKYFDRKAYLTESSQLYAEAMIYALNRVYSFAPTYRAEKSRTIKHLIEFWMLEPEMAYFDNKKNMKIQEQLISHVARRVATNDEVILEGLGLEKERLLRIRPPFKRISYDRAIDLLEELGSKKKWGDDFGVEEERLLTENEEKPIFIMYWPKEIKAFYMPINPRDKRTAMCADMLAPRGHGEIVGGSERIWKLDELLERMKEFRLKTENYGWYIDLRKYGSVPHAGFGLGVERVIKWLLNLEHIKDAIPFPRLINRIAP